jgi:hypothetical protein
MSTSSNHESQMESYVSRVEQSLEGVRADDLLEMLDELREVLFSHLHENVDTTFDPQAILGSPEIYALQLMEAAGYLKSTPLVAKSKKSSRVLAVTIALLMIFVPLFLTPAFISTGYSTIGRVPIFGVLAVLLYSLLMLALISLALGHGLTGVFDWANEKGKQKVSRFPFGPSLEKLVVQLRHVWWFFRGWVVAELISLASNSFRAKPFFPIPVLLSHRWLGLVLLSVLVFASFALGNQNEEMIKTTVLRYMLLFVNSSLLVLMMLLLYAQGDLGNIADRGKVDNIQILERVPVAVTVVVPGIVGQDFSNAHSYLQSIDPRLIACVTKTVKSNESAGLIVSQNPLPGESISFSATDPARCIYVELSAWIDNSAANGTKTN